jgi:uncharacterized protein YbaP (TraB family)
MPRRSTSWIVALAVAAVAASCRPASRANVVVEHPLLWSAQKDGTTTYLLGTMHLGFNAEKQLPRWVWDKIRNAKSFAMETDLSDPALMSSGQRRDGTTLRAELGEAYWQKLAAVLGPAAPAALRMTPAAASALVEAQGMPPTMPMDLLLLGEAESAGTSIVYLEPAVRQLAILDKWVDLRALKAALDDHDQGKNAAHQLLAAYIAGDVESLAAAGNDRAGFKKSGRSDAEYDEMMQDLLYRRNASWIDEIEAMHRAGGAVVAVGAMHLIGEGSVLALLQQRGFTIARVSAP